MAQETRILSGYNEDIEYTFDNMLLEEEDEMNESDVHIIEIFGKPYSIAMGKLKTIDQDETLGYFISYLLYENKVVRKLGIYEINKSANELETLNHRTFDFEKEKLLLFDEYYEDVKKLHPYMYKKENDLPKKNIIELKQGNIQFEEDDEKQQQFIEKLQERAEKFKPEKTQSVMDNYYKYITSIFSLLPSGSERSEIQTKIKSPKLDYFKTVKRKGGVSIILEESRLIENILSPDVKLGLFELLFFELLADVKIILVEDQDITFNLFPYKEGVDFSKINKVSLYSEFDPKNVLFIHTKVNDDDEKKTNILLYKDKPIVSFEDLDTELANIILQKMEENKGESDLPMRFKHFKSAYKTPLQDDLEETKTVELDEDDVPEEVEADVEADVEAEVEAPPTKISMSNNQVSAKLKPLNT